MRPCAVEVFGERDMEERMEGRNTGKEEKETLREKYIREGRRVCRLSKVERISRGEILRQPVGV